MKTLRQKVALFVTTLRRLLTQILPRFSTRIKKTATIIVFVSIAIIAGHTVSAQVAPSGPQAPPSLKSVSVPEPDDISNYIRDKTAAIALGKTLFWDMQVGSDGIQSCASCHFHAGTDSRSKNQINPGLDKIFNPGGGPNYQLTVADYPFHNLTDPNDRNSELSKDIDDVTGSQGVFQTKFNSINPGSAQDNTTVQPDPVFNVNGTNVRQVTSRNTPSVINAVYNFRNFWDGRAQNKFNGVNSFGDRDPNAYVYKVGGLLGLQLEKVKISLKNSAAASQAVGPPLTSLEESSTGRTFPDIAGKLTGSQRLELPREHGKKLRGLKPLGKQLVAKDDSVLGSFSNFPETGLKTTYAKLIKKAFKPEWWKSPQIIKIDELGNRTIVRKLVNLVTDLDGVVYPDQLSPQQFSLIDYNFPLFMGLAIQMYESTLVSDNSPYDQYQDGNTSALTAQQQQGLKVFLNSGCISCHGGAEFTAASVTNVQKNGRITQKPSRSNDTGFFNIGVTPINNDIGLGADDDLTPNSRPLSETRLAQQGSFQQVFGEAPNVTVGPKDTVNADGLFKTPGLRNVELTAPYFHNGGQLSLRQVVDFYSRGGGDANPSGPPPLPVLNLSEDDKEALVAFLKSLTDERVRYEKAPFDHPQLFVPNGHPGNQNSVTNDSKGQATDDLLEIPAVGRNGLNTPEPNFLGE
ncbi:MAG: cytochrome C peroxidase [Stigonema ocellatum SAG 48.90 = DSM 106950]|nr:cytochrome C peroxidase [Stigonema ocellatum SAG 48.90 = DSM 106950]